jgi:hypothetical protein
MRVDRPSAGAEFFGGHVGPKRSRDDSGRPACFSASCSFVEVGSNDDGAMLGGYIGVAEGNTAIAGALNAYDSEMKRYGFEVVRDSAGMGQSLIGQEPLPS